MFARQKRGTFHIFRKKKDLSIFFTGVQPAHSVKGAGNSGSGAYDSIIEIVTR
jgi:hypothetical protein